MRKVVLLLLSVVLFQAAGFAQCPSYDTADRVVVKDVLTFANQYVARAKELSYLGSFPQTIVSIGLHTQRAAIASEYDALIAALEQGSQILASWPRIAPSTRNFLSTVIRPSTLGLAGTKISGTTQAEAENSSQVANERTTRALDTLWACY